LWLVVASPWHAAADEGAVRVRWLGVAGFSIEAGDTVLLHDPYLSRPGLLRTLFWSYEADAKVLEPLLEEAGPTPELARASLILVGHSHFDHLGDVPWLALRTGAAVAGTPTTAHISHGYGVDPARTRQVAPGEVWSEGPFDLRAVESRHAKVLFGSVPLPGEVTEPPDAPIHSASFKMGGALGFLVTHRPTGQRIFVLSSAGVSQLALEELRDEGIRADVLLAATGGRQADYVPTLVSMLRPRWVVPHHMDDFFVPLDDPEAAVPADPEDLAAFEAEVAEAADDAGISVDVRRLGLFEVLELPMSPGP